VLAMWVCALGGCRTVDAVVTKYRDAPLLRKVLGLQLVGGLYCDGTSVWMYLALPQDLPTTYANAPTSCSSDTVSLS
jgi:hypothetical protein